MKNSGIIKPYSSNTSLIFSFITWDISEIYSSTSRILISRSLITLPSNDFTLFITKALNLPTIVEVL